VRCQLEVLRHCLAPSIRKTLEELPETLDETYERVLREICEPNRGLACRLLQCLTVALRPLRVEEFAEILAIDFDPPDHPELKPNWRWADQRGAVFLACSSLIEIVAHGDSEVVQFSHFSVKEYLTSDRLALSSDVSCYHILLEPAHTILAQACLGVLLSLDDSVNKSTMPMRFPLSNTLPDTGSTMRGSRTWLHAYGMLWSISLMRTNHTGQLGPRCKW
jgi:hypothetical protein